VAAIARKTLAHTRTIGVALSPCTVPQAGKPTFTIGEGEMEIGMGIHGEPGMKREGLQTADAITERMLVALLEDLATEPGDTVTLMLNSLGATPLEELYIMFRKAHEVLSARGLKVYRPYIGRFATSMEMAGASITLLRLDDELQALLDAPARSPFFVQC
jgi:phosphoenolpyruvate---glycerone phosphotransferase subunit DhaK